MDGRDGPGTRMVEHVADMPPGEVVSADDLRRRVSSAPVSAGGAL